MNEHAYILTLSCPDRLGLVHTVSGFLLEQSANIEEAAQYNDQATGLFFMRVQFACAAHDLASLKAAFAALAEPLQMRWSIHPRAERMKTVIMVSRQGHCLNDLLFRFKSGLLPVDIRAIISNHRDFYQLAASYNIPFHHIPVTAATKAQAEARQLEVIEQEGAELCWPVTCRCCPTTCAKNCKAAPSTSTTAFCPASRGPSPITRPMTGV